eukprot:10204163-Karenia_brevis.AAC.1
MYSAEEKLLEYSRSVQKKAKMTPVQQKPIFEPYEAPNSRGAGSSRDDNDSNVSGAAPKSRSLPHRAPPPTIGGASRERFGSTDFKSSCP